MFPIATSDMSQQAVGSGSVLYHCEVSDLKISTAVVYVTPPATISADWRLKTPGDHLAVGMEGIVCLHFRDLSSYEYTSSVAFSFLPPTATSLPLT